jgi:hypothetical protein
MHSHLTRTLCALAGGTLLAGAGWIYATRANAAPDPESRAALTAGFQKGSPDYKAIGPLTFSPSGVLFFADDQAGAVYGVDLMEKASTAKPCAQLADLGGAIAGKLGTTAKGIEIKDVAVSPVSHDVYLSVRKTDGADQDAANPANYALFCVDPAGKVSAVDLTAKPFGKVAIAGKAAYRSGPMAPARVVSDIAYAKGRVLATALSTEQFNSNLVSIPVPFNAAGVEKFATSIYHVSHKRQETASPIQTLAVYRDGDREYLMAAYICTPVVRFNLEDLKPGQVATGTTVAELGSGNRPMDMVAYGKPGEQSLLLNNSVFGIVKVDPAIAKETQAVNQMTKADRGGGGKTPYPGIQPLDSLKDVRAYAPAGDQLVVVRSTADNLALQSVALP